MSDATPSGPPTAPLAGERPRVLDVVFVLDCSGSMAGERIGSLNYAIRSAIPAMRSAAMEHPGVQVMVRVLRFGDQVDWRVASPVRVEDFVWSNAEAGGETNMGAAFRALVTAFGETAGDPVLQLPPVVVLLSDGYATDDAQSGLDVFLASPHGSRAIRIPIAIGQDADLDLLQAFIGDPVLQPLQASNAEMLVSRVRWAASVPMAEVSKGSAEPLAAVADRVAEAGGASPVGKVAGDLLW